MSKHASEILTIGLSGRSAESFFTTLTESGVTQLLDVRLRNTSQLAGFAKKDDLAYFLREIAAIDYLHIPELAPTADLLTRYKRGSLSWSAYEMEFLDLLRSRRAETIVDPDSFKTPTALLCTEASAERCHRRLVAEYFAARLGDVTVRHL
jgi:uncharacterized protein (DUF488 family)